MHDTKGLILLPRLRVHNANAVSGPLSWGFPSPTAFTGFTHALERRLRETFDIHLGGVGIVCHRFDPQVHRPNRRRHQTFALTRNPLIAGWKKYEDKPAALVEEGRAHLEVSLLIESLTELDEEQIESLETHLPGLVGSMRLGGGSIRPAFEENPRYKPAWKDWPEYSDGQDEVFRKLRRRLLPGFALVQREDLLAEHLTGMREQAPNTDALDALLDLNRLNFEPGEVDPNELEKNIWEIRKRPGWLVPLPVGYAALSPLYGPGEVSHARDQRYSFRFVESLYTLGQWLSPHRLTRLEDLLWRHHADLENGIYRTVNQYTPIEQNL